MRAKTELIGAVGLFDSLSLMSNSREFAMNFRSYLAGLALLGTSASGATIHYADVNSTNPVSPFLDWSTAATNVPQALNAALSGESVLVAAGVYRSANSGVAVSITRNVQLRSVSGPDSTFIEGNSTGNVSRPLDLAASCVVDG